MKFWLKIFIENTKFFFGETSRERKRIILKFSGGVELAKAYFRFRKELYFGDYHQMKNHLDLYWTVAFAAADVRFMTSLWLVEERLGRYISSIRHEYISYIIDRGDCENLLDILSEKVVTLLLKESEREGIGNGVLFLGLILELARKIEALTVVVDKRLLKIWQRSLLPYKNIVVVSESEYKNRGDIRTINLTELKYMLLNSEESISAAILGSPLVADAASRDTFRARMKAVKPDLPIVGLVWRSSNPGKTSPCFEDWLKLVRQFPAIYVLLQYSIQSYEFDAFRESAKASGSFIYWGVKNLTGDLDHHFAEIAAVDIVVTIPSSVAYFSSALGIRALVIVDVGFSRQFPIMSNFSPWHPNATMIRPNNSSYGESMVRVARSLENEFCGSVSSGDRSGV